MWLSKPSINLNDIKLFKGISSKKVLEILAKILDTELSEDRTINSVTRYTLNGVTIELTSDYNYLDLEEALEFAESTISSITKNRFNNELEELYKATLLNTFIYILFKDYVFFKRKEKELIKSKLVNIDTIKTYLSWLNFSKDKEIFDLENLNDRTIVVLKSTLEELGYDYKEKDNKLYIGYIKEDKDIGQNDESKNIHCTYINNNDIPGI